MSHLDARDHCVPEREIPEREPCANLNLSETEINVFIDRVNSLFKLKLFLIKHGKCTACTGRPKVQYCGRCFNTRLEPEVLEAITVLDLAAKFDENADQVFENVSSDDYVNPPQDSYFARIKEKRSRLESLYQALQTGHLVETDREAFSNLIREVIR